MDRTTFRIDDYLRPDEAFHFARKRLAKRFPKKAHDHDFFEVFLIESGRTAHWVNGVTQYLTRGQLVFLRPVDAHAFCADQKAGCQIINVMFRRETAAHLADRYGATIGGRFFDAGAALPETHQLAASRFARAVNVAQQLQTAERSLARIEEFLLFLTNRVALASTSDQHNAPHWFAEACSAAQSREVFAKGAPGFIKTAGRSHEHVCRTCKAVTGLTPSQYINQIRIAYAADLLRSDEVAIDDVIRDCGFENTSYFYRLFRRQLGMTPRAYRLAHMRDPFQSVG
ncbi:MAG: AraC family transcriptional regulator [Pseudomonadota bacterium]